MYTSNLKIDELRFIAEYKNIKIQNYKIMKICKKVDWILELEYFTSILKIDELRFIAEYKNIKIQNYKIMKICKKVDWILELKYFNQHPLGWVRGGVGVGEHSHKFNNFNVLNTKSSFQQLFVNYVYFDNMEYLTIVMCLFVHSSE